MSLRRYALCPLSSSFPELRNAVRTLRYASAVYVVRIHLASVCNVYRGEIIHVGCKTSACIITHLCHHLRAVGSMCISAVNYDLRTLLALAYKCMQCTEFVVVIDRDCKKSHAYIPINDRGGIHDLMFGMLIRWSYKRATVEGGSTTRGVRWHALVGKLKNNLERSKREKETFKLWRKKGGWWRSVPIAWICACRWCW